MVNWYRLYSCTGVGVGNFRRLFRRYSANHSAIMDAKSEYLWSTETVSVSNRSPFDEDLLKTGISKFWDF